MEFFIWYSCLLKSGLNRIVGLTSDQILPESSTRFGGQSRTYGFDGAFNRTNVNGSNGAVSFTRTQGPNTWNQTQGTSTTQSGVTKNTAYTYDGEGNRANLSDGTQVLTYAYDSQQRLTAVNRYVNGVGPTPVLKCGYRCDGLRAWKENGAGVRTYFLYDGSNLVGEFDTNGVAQATQTWGAEGLAYRRQLTGTTPATKFYSWDARGNIAATTDATGAIVNTPTSDAFNSSGGVEPCATFGGQVGGYRDAETGLVLFGQRYYDGFLGQWLTRDPIRESGGVNLYSYVGGNPVNRLDPYGLDWLDNASNFSAGAGDFLSFGGTILARKSLGIDDVVNSGSGAYLGGTLTGAALAVAIMPESAAGRGGAAIAERAAIRAAVINVGKHAAEGAVSGGLGGAISGYTGQIANQQDGKGFSRTAVVNAAVAGAITGAATGAVASLIPGLKSDRATSLLSGATGGASTFVANKLGTARDNANISPPDFIRRRPRKSKGCK